MRLDEADTTCKKLNCTTKIASSNEEEDFVSEVDAAVDTIPLLEKRGKHTSSTNCETERFAVFAETRKSHQNGASILFAIAVLPFCTRHATWKFPPQKMRNA